MILPSLAVVLLVFCDYAFAIFQTTLAPRVVNYTLVIVYLTLSVMALWSLLMACSKDPGYIARRYTYDQSKLSQTVQALLKFTKEEQNQYQVVIPMPSDKH